MVLGDTTAVHKLITYNMWMIQFIFAQENKFHEEDDECAMGYEIVSWQMINLDKSYYYLHEKVPATVCNQIRRITGVRQCNFSFTYLEFPMFYGMKKKVHFKDLVKKKWREAWLRAKTDFYRKGEVCLNCTCITFYAYVSIIRDEPTNWCHRNTKLFA